MRKEVVSFPQACKLEKFQAGIIAVLNFLCKFLRVLQAFEVQLNTLLTVTAIENEGVGSKHT